ncbi:MAG: RsmD family RNA methyltransferase [Rikenellaceae bacterium]|nr:RsmD family RNA methyltransferase [Rikenellaceae bacterium]
MFDRDQFELLKDKEVRSLIEKNIDCDPQALSLILKCDRKTALAVCTQIKFLQRCKAKIPKFYEVRCIIPPLSYEQSSSHVTAESKQYSGNLCIDLTCGLGVDTYFFSKNFKEVITVERDDVLTDIARYNLKLLGVENVTVINDSAENFLANYSGSNADLIYIDPARRDGEGKKIFILEDCSPDVTSILDKCLEISTKTTVKLSPMYDIKELIEKLSPRLSAIEVVSIRDECKEVIAECSHTPHESVSVTINVDGKKRFEFSADQIGRTDGKMPDILKQKFLLIPDVGFYKSRLTTAYFMKYHSEETVYTPSLTGFSFSDHLPYDFCGKAYAVAEIMEYNPKKIKKLLKQRGLRGLTILKKDFPAPAASIKNTLNIREGGSTFAAFTSVRGVNYFMLLGKRAIFVDKPHLSE